MAANGKQASDRRFRQAIRGATERVKGTRVGPPVRTPTPGQKKAALRDQRIKGKKSEIMKTRSSARSKRQKRLLEKINLHQRANK